MGSEKKLSNIKIFVCSTFVDLRAYRDAVIKRIKSHAGVINAQEFFGARAQEPLATCLEELNQANVFVMFLGPRYGSIDSDSGFSFVECEYKRATELGLPRFAYIIDESYPFPIEHVSTGDDAKRLRKFKARVQNDLTVDFFTGPEDLASKVYSDLVRELPKKGFKIGEPEEHGVEASSFRVIGDFLALPKLFHGRTVSFSATFGDYRRASWKECEAFSYEYGAAVKRKITPLDEDLKRLLKDRLGYLFASQKDALRLIDIDTGTEILATVKTVQGIYRESTPIYGNQFPEITHTFLNRKVIVDYDEVDHLICGLEVVDLDAGTGDG